MNGRQLLNPLARYKNKPQLKNSTRAHTHNQSKAMEVDGTATVCRAATIESTIRRKLNGSTSRWQIKSGLPCNTVKNSKNGWEEVNAAELFRFSLVS